MSAKVFTSEMEFAAVLLCDAIAALRSGRAGKCATILDHVAVLLPDVGLAEQAYAKARRSDAGVGFEALRGSV